MYSDILVSFDVSLFTRVPLIDTIELFKPLFKPEIAQLFEFALTSSYFCLVENSMNRKDGVALDPSCSESVHGIL